MVKVNRLFSELYEHEIVEGILLVIPVHVGVSTCIICKGIDDEGFHSGKSTNILPLVFSMFLGVNCTVIDPDESPINRELGVMVPDDMESG